MGNHRIRAITFRQSQDDFPVAVSLGKKMPSWGLSRWGGLGSLRFAPLDDEGFSVRGDCKRLLYKGRRQSHRFTILGNNAFEYDVILKREPDCNVVTLRMEGAEGFDFYRQPDFLREPLLAGSYAVYKKDTLLGEGTGKLCHIHRPEIIDALGRRCWGDLAVAGNDLRITIPEGFLSTAVYPVIVDPVVGTSTVGSQYKWVNEPGEPPIDLMFELTIPVNQFSVTETINGNCTAYAYVNSDDTEAGGCPVLYSDGANAPLYRRSAREGNFDFRVNKSKSPGWRSAAFQPSEPVAAGSNIWFGVFTEYYWMPRFDYASIGCRASWWWDSYDPIPDDYGIPAVYPPTPADRYNFRLSMYFDYSSGQSYVRTLTQGVSLSDRQWRTADCKRTATQTAGGITVLGKVADYKRLVTQSVRGVAALGRFARFSRQCVAVAHNVSVLGIVRDFMRVFSETAESGAETSRSGEFYRSHADTVRAHTSVFRGLLLLVKIVTTVFVRDYVLRRFLKSKSELVLKSPVSREIILESKLN